MKIKNNKTITININELKEALANQVNDYVGGCDHAGGDIQDLSVVYDSDNFVVGITFTIECEDEL
jgi:hypothetical protein